MTAEPERTPGGAPVPDPAPRRRRGPRRATGGTFTGAEPRLAGLDGRAPGADEEATDGTGERAREEWLRAQRPPHWD